MKDGPDADLNALHTAAQTYCDAVYYARADVFEQLCHDRFQMTEVTTAGETQHWDKAAYIARVNGRHPFPGEVSAKIITMDVAGGDMGRVHLWVDVPPRRYEDHLGFVYVDGAWKLLTKVFRTMGASAEKG